jgi:hypothetical protein
MRRIFVSEEDRRFMNRWRLIAAAAYATAALVIMLVSASLSPAARHTTAAARPAPQAVAHR